MSKADELKVKNENLFERNTILLNENERLKKEIAELKELKKKKEEIEIMTNFCKTCKKMHTDQLTKAKEIIKEFVFLLTHTRTALDTKTVMQKAEQFLKEIEK